MKIFRSKRPELSRGHWREKVSDLFGQTAHFSPVGSGRKKFPKKRTTWTVFLQRVLGEIASGDPIYGPDGTGLFGKW